MRRKPAPGIAASNDAGGRAAGPLPNFLIIGAMKAGTTSLFHYLRAHPQVFMASVKELDFFVEEGNWRRGLEWYRGQFRAAPEHATAIGEASTRYTKYPQVRGVPSRIAAEIPKARLIYVVRDPIDRIRSHYQHRVALGTERSTIDKAVLRDPKYLDCSRYGLQLQQYLEHFPRSSLLIITSEELRVSRPSTMELVYEFLGVDGGFSPEELTHEFYKSDTRTAYSPAGWQLRKTLKKYVPASKRAKELVDSRLPRHLHRALGGTSNAAEQSFVVSDDLRERLSELLADDISALRALMPEDFDGWGIA